MKRLFIQTHKFSEVLDQLISQNKTFSEDYEDLEKRLLANSDEGDVVQRTGGLRKTRLKSVSKGKNGGFRVCYCDVPEKGKIFLIAIFAKNVKEDLSDEEKKLFKTLIGILRKE